MTRGTEGRAMAINRRPSFDPKSFLAKVGEGRSIGEYGLVTSAAGLPSLTYSRTIRDDQNQL